MMSVWRCTFHGQQSGETIDVVQHFTSDQPATVSGATSLGNEMSDDWTTYILPKCVDDYEYEGCLVEEIYSPTIGYDHLEPAAGGGTGNPAPIFVVAKVDLVTGLRGRSYRGRWGWPGVAASSIDPTDGDQLTSAAVSDYQLALDSFYGATSARGNYIAVVSYVHDGAPRPSPIFTAVSNPVVRRNLGSRVSRKRR